MAATYPCHTSDFCVSFSLFFLFYMTQVSYSSVSSCNMWMYSIIFNCITKVPRGILCLFFIIWTFSFPSLLLWIKHGLLPMIYIVQVFLLYLILSCHFNMLVCIGCLLLSLNTFPSRTFMSLKNWIINPSNYFKVKFWKGRIVWQISSNVIE